LQYHPAAGELVPVAGSGASTSKGTARKFADGREIIRI
jgi:hypothetical protein